MRSFTRRRPSPALLVAFLALLVALGGTGVAATTYISAKNIKKNSIPGDRLKSDTVTGKQVKESSLATVPAAKAADTATSAATAANATNAQSAATAQSATTAQNATSAATAANADKVGGVTVKQFAVKVATDGAEATVLDAGGLLLKLSCPSGEPVLTAKNVSGADNMLARGTFTSVNSTNVTGSSDLDVSDPAVSLFNGATESRGTVVAAGARDGAPSMTMSIALDDANTYGQFVGCSAVGNATIG